LFDLAFSKGELHNFGRFCFVLVDNYLIPRAKSLRFGLVWVVFSQPLFFERDFGLCFTLKGTERLRVNDLPAT
jgi:hypothetical protein